MWKLDKFKDKMMKIPWILSLFNETWLVIWEITRLIYIYRYTPTKQMPVIGCILQSCWWLASVIPGQNLQFRVKVNIQTSGVDVTVLKERLLQYAFKNYVQVSTQSPEFLANKIVSAIRNAPIYSCERQSPWRITILNSKVHFAHTFSTCITSAIIMIILMICSKIFQSNSSNLPEAILVYYVTN